MHVGIGIWSAIWLAHHEHMHEAQKSFPTSLCFLAIGDHRAHEFDKLVVKLSSAVFFAGDPKAVQNHNAISQETAASDKGHNLLDDILG